MEKLFDHHFDFYDVSPEISENLAVWPGDTPFQRSLLCHFTKGDQIILSTIRATLHLGVHADAPNHYHPEGHGIESRDIRYYIGSCQVITVSKLPNQQILPEDLANHRILAKRILFKTESYLNPNQWHADFISLSPSLIEFLAKKGVVLVGIDTPSIDPAHSKLLETHQAVFKSDMAILEGLVLKEVPDGEYTLVALPLKIKGADASPVRAILLKGKVF